MYWKILSACACFFNAHAIATNKEEAKAQVLALVIVLVLAAAYNTALEYNPVYQCVL